MSSEKAKVKSGTLPNDIDLMNLVSMFSITSQYVTQGRLKAAEKNVELIHRVLKQINEQAGTLNMDEKINQVEICRE